MIHSWVWQAVLRCLLLFSLLLAASNSFSAQRFDTKTWTQPEYQAVQDYYMSLPGAGVESYSYRPDGTGLCLRDDVNTVVVQFGTLDCAASFPGYNILNYDASTTTSSNLINNDNWSGLGARGTDPGGCCTSISGSGALYEINTDTIMFSYGQALVSQTIAINQALAASGIQVDGYQYGWTYRLIGKDSVSSSDTLVFTVEVKDSSGNVVETYTYDRSGIAAPDPTFNPAWTTEQGFEVFASPYTDPSTIQLKILGQDGGYWGGYYGPEVKDVMLNLMYRADPCSADPLYDASCPGYAEALAQQIYDQNCAADPLYDSGCPGYAQAFYTQQCTINPLYDAGCPGYADAYYDQQCSLDPLYDAGCVGYAQAYYDQQCTANPLYDVNCPNYSSVNTSPNIVNNNLIYADDFIESYLIAEALRLSGANLQLFGFDYGFDYKLANDYEVCSNTILGICTSWKTVNSFIDGAFSVVDDNNNVVAIDTYYNETGTTSEWTEFRNRLLIENGITMADAAFVKFDYELYAKADVKNLTAEALFVGDPCADNALYSTMCSGYAEAYLAEQCSIVGPLYDTACPGYAEAFTAQQCTIVGPLYDASCPGYAQAYFDQQCTLDQTYDPACPEYNNYIGTDGSVNQWDPTDQASTGNLWNQNAWGQIVYQPPVYDGNYSNKGTYWQFYHYMYNGSAAWRQMATINAALKAQGISVDGVKYGWEIDNNMYANSYSNLTVTLRVTDASGNNIMTDSYNYTWADGDIDLDAVKYFGVDTIQEQVNGANLTFHFQDRDGGAYRGNYIVSPSTIYTEFVYHVDECIVNPLFSSTCEGYAEAYYDQQCGINPLYDSGCPGYAQAYYDQQCTVSALYDQGCPGYAQAYYDQQCTIDALYDSGCPGYAEAYFDQQCSISQLYSTECPLYESAYYDFQCALDPLYDSGCTGYEEAYYAKYIAPELEKQAEAAAGVSSDPTSTTSTTSDTTALAEDPVAALTEPSATGDATVDEVLRDNNNVTTTIELPGMDTTASSPGQDMQTTEGGQDGGQDSTESSAEADTAGEMEELVAMEDGGSNEEDTQSSDNVDESSNEESDSDGGSESGESDSGDDAKDEKSSSDDSKKSEKSEKDKEKSKREKMKEIATKRAMALAETMSNAASLEAQQAVQAQITALINFVPGFNQYGQLGIPGVPFYPVEEIYQDKKIPENRQGLRNGLAQQILHEKMVDMQYENLNKEQ